MLHVEQSDVEPTEVEYHLDRIATALERIAAVAEKINLPGWLRKR
jgi:hypothetical protein